MKKFIVFSFAVDRQRGYALVGVLLVMLLGAAVITPLLQYMGTGTVTTSRYQAKTEALYAADAGISDGQWVIKKDQLEAMFPGPNPIKYDPYDYSAGHSWQYPLTVPQVNGYPVNVTISNVWMPKGLAAPSPSAAQTVIEGAAGNPPDLVVTSPKGTAPTTTTPGTFKIELSYSGTDTLNARTLGIWLPSGFTLVPGTTNLNNTRGSGGRMYTEEKAPALYKSGTAVLWTFSNYPFKGDTTHSPFPGVDVNQPTLVSTVTFQFNGPVGQIPDAVAWIDTNLDLGGGLTYTWNGDLKVCKITSEAGGTSIDAYAVKRELREMASAIAGDYYAVGRSLMINTFPNQNHRDTLLTSSSRDVNTANSGIPDGANVELAYLYWSGWVQGNKNTALGQNGLPTYLQYANGVFWDNCGTLTPTDPNNKFTQTGTWNVVTNPTHDNTYYERFQGHGNAASLTAKSDIDLSGIPQGQASIHWDQSTETNPNLNVFSDPGNSANFSASWTSGADWGYYNNRYRGQNLSGTTGALDPIRYITLKNPLDLSAYYSASSVTLSWTWSSTNLNNDQSKGMDVEISSDGTNFVKIAGFTGDKASEVKTFQLAPQYRTSTFKMRFRVVGFSYQATSYVRVQSINVDTPNPSTLYFQISNNGDSGPWSTPYAALQGNNPPPTSQAYYPSQRYSFVVPSGYYTSHFRIRFYLSGFNAAGEAAYIDNILITNDSITTYEDRNISLGIQTNDGTGTAYSTLVSADPADTAHDAVWSAQCMSGSTPDGTYYAIRKDVTDLVKQYSNGANLAANPPVYGNGKATYTVGDVFASNKSSMNYSQGSTPGRLGDASYAGWSLLIVYSSPATKGHQLFLYEDMTSVNYQTSGGATVIDKSLNGFVVPAQVAGESDAGRLTCFVGEGDLANQNDYVAFLSQGSTTEHKLWDGVDCSASPWGSYGNSSGSANNVWNGFSGDSASPTTAGAIAGESGVDVDTFHIKWSDNWLQQGDTSATVRLSTNGDGYTLIYMIISFRSQTSAGGALSYLIRN